MFEKTDKTVDHGDKALADMRLLVGSLVSDKIHLQSEVVRLSKQSEDLKLSVVEIATYVNSVTQMLITAGLAVQPGSVKNTEWPASNPTAVPPTTNSEPDASAGYL